MTSSEVARETATDSVVGRRASEWVTSVDEGHVPRGLPKSGAGLRVVTLPRPVVELLSVHLTEHVGADPESLVFTGERARCCGGALQPDGLAP